jgi:hypothetical protein
MRPLALLIASIGCSSSSVSYRLQIDAGGSRAASEADSLAIHFERGLDSTHRTRLAVPDPRPQPPWVLEVAANGWGSSHFTVVVEAFAGENLIAAGRADTDSTLVEVALADQELPDLGADLARVIAPDLASPAPSSPDLASSNDLSAPPDLGCANLRVTELGAVADNVIQSSAPTTNRGSEGALVLTSGDTRALLRFDVSSIPPTVLPREVSVEMQYMPQSWECNGTPMTSGACDSVDTAGSFELHFLEYLWSEGGSSWNLWANFPQYRSWQMPGASGPLDRSDVVGVAGRVAHGDLSLPLDGDKLQQFIDWRGSDNSLSFEIVPASGSAMFRAREYAVESCPSGATALQIPVLRVVWCADGVDM